MANPWVLLGLGVAGILLVTKKLKKTIKESAKTANEKGNKAFKDKQWEKAIDLYSKAINLSNNNYNNATYYNNRAAAYIQLGSFLQAQEDSTKAITLYKKYAKAYLRRGNAREMLGCYKEALNDYDYALFLEPNNKRAALLVERLRAFLFQECSICLCAYERGVELRELPCKHSFHRLCVDEWLSINPTCPLCKLNILTFWQGRIYKMN